MTRTEQSAVAFGVGALITIGVMLFVQTKIPEYSVMKLDGTTLKDVYNGSNFSKIIFQFKLNSSTEKFDLVAEIYNTSGTMTTTPAGLLTATGKTVKIRGDRSLTPYELRHQRHENRQQLMQLVSIMAATERSYLLLTPADYGLRDPNYKTRIYYNITAHTVGDAPIPRPPAIPARVFLLDPCPPAVPF